MNFVYFYSLTMRYKNHLNYCYGFLIDFIEIKNMLALKNVNEFLILSLYNNLLFLYL